MRPGSLQHLRSRGPRINDAAPFPDTDTEDDGLAAWMRRMQVRYTNVVTAADDIHEASAAMLHRAQAGVARAVSAADTTLAALSMRAHRVKAAANQRARHAHDKLLVGVEEQLDTSAEQLTAFANAVNATARTRAILDATARPRAVLAEPPATRTAAEPNVATWMFAAAGAEPDATLSAALLMPIAPRGVPALDGFSAVAAQTPDAVHSFLNIIRREAHPDASALTPLVVANLLLQDADGEPCSAITADDIHVTLFEVPAEMPPQARRMDTDVAIVQLGPTGSGEWQIALRRPVPDDDGAAVDTSVPVQALRLRVLIGAAVFVDWMLPLQPHTVSRPFKATYLTMGPHANFINRAQLAVLDVSADGQYVAFGRRDGNTLYVNRPPAPDDAVQDTYSRQRMLCVGGGGNEQLWHAQVLTSSQAAAFGLPPLLHSKPYVLTASTTAEQPRTLLVRVQQITDLALADAPRCTCVLPVDVPAAVQSIAYADGVMVVLYALPGQLRVFAQEAHEPARRMLRGAPRARRSWDYAAGSWGGDSVRAVNFTVTAVTGLERRVSNVTVHALCALTDDPRLHTLALNEHSGRVDMVAPLVLRGASARDAIKYVFPGGPDGQFVVVGRFATMAPLGSVPEDAALASLHYENEARLYTASGACTRRVAVAPMASVRAATYRGGTLYVQFESMGKEVLHILPWEQWYARQ